MLFNNEINTPLGPVVAIADATHLLFLEFKDANALLHKQNVLGTTPIPVNTTHSCAPLASIEQELKAYFAGSLKRFQTPIRLTGTNFQNRVWQALIRIPYGETHTYKQIAEAIQHPTAFRAVANANGANRLVIIVPCHRIIRHNGDLGGYSSVIDKKQYLLKLEQT